MDVAHSKEDTVATLADTARGFARLYTARYINTGMPDFTDRTEPTISFDGSQTVEELNEAHPSVPMIAKGKLAIKDIGKRLAQIRGLKPGSTSIRTDEMIEEILTRLTDGETLTSILCDEHMPAKRTLDNWCDRDMELDHSIMKAQAKGQRTLADIRLDIAQGGQFSTQDVRRDDLLIKAINANISQRNRAEFGEKVQVDHQRVVLNVPEWVSSVAVRTITDASFEPMTDDSEDDEGE